MRAVDIIMKKRGTRASNAKNELSAQEIKFFVDGYVSGTISDYQMSAFLMAVYFNGMTFKETGFLTEAMLNSGDRIDFHKNGENAQTIFTDKHSTGGVGDKISLPLAPIVAACGVKDPMMSGRALGHTGGTLDKLESIFGYRVNLSEAEFKAGIDADGFAMMGQTPKIAPADKKMYALRDVTATVESVPLITASILSKKIAEGADALVFDVKCGSGAFMKNQKEAEELATFLVETAKTMGKKASAFITNMDFPLGRTVGNFLEIEETIDCLKGKGPADVMELTYCLGEEMLVLSKNATSQKDARQKMEEAISSGRALERFLSNVKRQGGDVEKLMSEIGKRRSQFKAEFVAQKSGFLSFDAFKIGLAGVNLGVGRNRADEDVFADAGMIFKSR